MHSQRGSTCYLFNREVSYFNRVTLLKEPPQIFIRIPLQLQGDSNTEQQAEHSQCVYIYCCINVDCYLHVYQSLVCRYISY